MTSLIPEKLLNARWQTSAKRMRGKLWEWRNQRVTFITDDSLAQRLGEKHGLSAPFVISAIYTGNVWKRPAYTSFSSKNEYLMEMRDACFLFHKKIAEETVA